MSPVLTIFFVLHFILHIYSYINSFFILTLNGNEKDCLFTYLRRVRSQKVKTLFCDPLWVSLKPDLLKYKWDFLKRQVQVSSGSKFYNRYFGLGRKKYLTRFSELITFSDSHYFLTAAVIGGSMPHNNFNNLPLFTRCLEASIWSKKIAIFQVVKLTSCLKAQQHFFFWTSVLRPLSIILFISSITILSNILLVGSLQNIPNELEEHFYNSLIYFLIFFNILPYFFWLGNANFIHPKTENSFLRW